MLNFNNINNESVPTHHTIKIKNIGRIAPLYSPKRSLSLFKPKIRKNALRGFRKVSKNY
jgi:hypothetical protein